MQYQGLNTRYTLEDAPIARGGEGDVFRIAGDSGRVAKIYHANRLTPTLEEKLNVMLRRPPAQDVISQVAWPLDLLRDASGRFCGFIMPSLPATHELTTIYAYPPTSNITVTQKLVIAQNICVVIAAVHQAGYVFGDFNPRNIGVNAQTGRVAFFDTDSYHIFDPASGKTYRCGVGFDDYIAPELLRACAGFGKSAYLNAPLPTFTAETDNFALAIHIFRLLMNGYTPFNGVNEDASLSSSSASPGLGNEAIKRDSYCFKPGNRPQSVAVPPVQSLPDEIAALFQRAFILGRNQPAQRPGALEWREALVRYEARLKPCTRNAAHQYLDSLRSCPWCVADAQYAASLRKAVVPALRQRSYTPPAPPPVVPPVAAYAAQPKAPVRATASAAQPRPQKPGKNYERNALWDVIRSTLVGFLKGWAAALAIYVVTIGGMFIDFFLEDGWLYLSYLPFIMAGIGFLRGLWRNTGK